MTRKLYLGDGAYAAFDGWHVVVTTEDGYEATNTIYLDRSVYEALVDFAEVAFRLAESKGGPDGHPKVEREQTARRDPRCMLPRAQNEARGIPALERLIRIAHGDHGQACRVRRFLLGLYNGEAFPLDLTDLRALDHDVQEDALAVLAMDMDGPSVEVQNRISGTSEVIAEWAADAWPDHEE
ncbi:MAG TPA: hypothetical protein VMO26_00310 [Vicinamibacterales bacterium]|nr:hypothetical protein [Vicinamibacterales bacterium]